MLKASASANFLFPGAGIDHIVAQAAGSGFDAVEFQFLYPGEAEKFAPVIAASPLEVALINFDAEDFARGGGGFSGVPGREKDFEAALGIAFRNAQLLSPRIANIGPSRIPAGVSRNSCVRQLADNLRRALDRLSVLRTRVAIEALNRAEYPDVLIGSPEEAMEVIEAVGDNRLVLQYDMYHGARDGRNIARDLEVFMSSLGHVQFADCPGRAEPGTGTVDFVNCFATLRTVGYSGFVGAEYRPSTNFSDSLGWMALLE